MRKKVTEIDEGIQQGMDAVAMLQKRNAYYH